MYSKEKAIRQDRKEETGTEKEEDEVVHYFYEHDL